MIKRLILFGATGDLAGRFLLPAIAELYEAGKLPEDFRVVASATQDLTTEKFQQLAALKLEEHSAKDVSADSRAAVLRSFSYRRVDFNDEASVAAIVAEASGKGDGDAKAESVAAYLALPTGVFPAAIKALDAVGLPAGSRIILEKPFGENLEDAIALNQLLEKVTGAAGEQAIFRVDHALAMATVQNLLGVRLANRVFEPVWNSQHIEQIEILWEETLALENRAGYYDRAGALKDVIQNHLLQVLCIIAMEPPMTIDEKDFRDGKFDALRSVRRLTVDKAAANSRRARYTAGKLADTGGASGREVPTYIEEKGVDPNRNTETFAEIVLELDNWRWSGTRFVLRAGKAFGRRRKEAIVKFRAVPRLPFGEQRAAPNELHIGLDGPYGFALHLTGIESGPPAHLAPMVLDTELHAPDLPAYSRVLINALKGNLALSIRGDEAEEAWRIVMPVLEAWALGKVPMEEYPAGSEGPPPK